MAQRDVPVENYIHHHTYAEKGSGIVDAAGTFTMDFGPPKPGYIWHVERIVIKNDGVLVPEFRVFEVSQGTRPGSESLEDLIEFTFLGLGNVADEFSPPVIHPGSVLRCRFIGATVGSACSIRFQIRESVVQRLTVPTDAHVAMTVGALGNVGTPR